MKGKISQKNTYKNRSFWSRFFPELGIQKKIDIRRTWLLNLFQVISSRDINSTQDWNCVPGKPWGLF